MCPCCGPLQGCSRRESLHHGALWSTLGTERGHHPGTHWTGLTMGWLGEENKGGKGKYQGGVGELNMGKLRERGWNGQLCVNRACQCSCLDPLSVCVCVCLCDGVCIGFVPLHRPQSGGFASGPLMSNCQQHGRDWDKQEATGQTECLRTATGGSICYTYLYILYWQTCIPVSQRGAQWDCWCWLCLCKCSVSLFVICADLNTSIYKYVCCICVFVCVCLLGIHA